MRRKTKSTEPPKNQKSQRTTAWIVCGFLLLGVWIVFGQTIQYEFVNYDDDVFVYNNPAMKNGLTLSNLGWAMTATQGSQWAPLTWISYLADFQLYGMKPAGYHLTNVVLHSITVILLFLILWQMTDAIWPSAFVAAVFAVHPLHVESVAWVAERKGVLCGMFFMLTLGAYLYYVRRPASGMRYWTIAVFFALGLLAKPAIVALPFVLLLLDYWPLGRMASGKLKGLIVKKIPLFLLMIASCAAAPFTQGKAVIELAKLPMSSRIANALVSYVAYLGQSFWPANMAVFYPHPTGGISAAATLVALLILVGISTIAWIFRRKMPYFFVGWLWFVGMLVPVIGLVQIGLHAKADRYMYLPQIGLCIAVTWGCLRWSESWPYREWIRGAIALLVLMVLIGDARIQAAYWRNSESLWMHTLACTSQNNLAHSNLGVELARLGRADESIAQYEKALEICPDDAESHSNLGAVLMTKNRFDEAIGHYRQAIQLKPNYAEAHSNFGVALGRLGRFDEAVSQYEAALKIRPRYVEAISNLGNALARMRRFDEAIARYREALEIEPDRADVQRNLAVVSAMREKAKGGEAK
jgi:tetratricopeptide (TPR) repeat protein